MNAEVSVIMPVYNMALYIKDAIDSILQQSFRNLELIVVDDASTDDCAKLVTTYSDFRIRLIRNEKNTGNYPSRNKGLKVAKGKYICVMDADDVADPERIRIQFDYMESNPDVLACGCQFSCINSKHRYPKPLKYLDIRLKLLDNNCFLHPSLFIRTETMKELGGYNETYKYSSDYDLVCRLSLKGKIINLPDTLMKYRIHSTQISSSYQSEQKQFADEIRINYQMEMIKRFQAEGMPLPEKVNLQNPTKGKAIFYCHFAKYIGDLRFERLAEQLMENSELKRTGSTK